MNGIDEDLFTYEVEIPELTNIPCDLNKDDDLGQPMTHGSDDDMEYNPSDVEFIEWLASKFYNYKTMDHLEREHYRIIRLEEMMKLNLLTKKPTILMMRTKLLKSLGSRPMYMILRHLHAYLSKSLMMCRADMRAKKHKEDSRAKIEGLESTLKPSHRSNTLGDLEPSSFIYK
ncbi:hypothetical protein Tco_0093749 [Tanacetum coccineum]